MFVALNILWNFVVVIVVYWSKFISELSSKSVQSIVDAAVRQWCRRLKRLCPCTWGTLRA